MKVTLSTDSVTKVRADLLAIGVFGSPGSDPFVKAIDSASNKALSAVASLEQFEGSVGQTVRATPPGIGAKQVVLVGLGEGSPTIESVRRLASVGARMAQNYGTLALAVPGIDGDDAQALSRAAASGALLGAYRYTQYLTGDRAPKKSLSSAKLLVGKRSASLRNGVNAGIAIGESANHARDLVNAPPNDLNPTALANFAKAQCKSLGVTCKVWDKKGIQKLGMHLLLAVSRGSSQEPRFIHMTHKPKGVKNAPKVVYVGKGLTFDAGGLCLKPAKSMLDMKCDMGGAATTIGLVLAAARLNLPVEVHGVIASTENMLGADAYRPGDVFPSLDGKTVEIINTDAEGRLVLADALAYARELGGEFLIDHATLTGACMVALGPWRAGMFTHDDELAGLYREAAEHEGEKYWRMPLDRGLREMLKSNIADLKHTGERVGGSITAGLFLNEFAGEARFMHLDIAGPAFQDRVHGIHPKGGTGFGVMTAVRFLEALGSKS